MRATARQFSDPRRLGGETAVVNIDPVVSLAASMYAAPGTYAMLVGSGISHSAGVPTGWDVVLDLIRKVAMLTDGSEPNDPLAWFRSRSDADPDYSVLLEQLAPTPAGRRDLLNAYFEPTDDERERGVKVATAAHRAIAELVAAGFVRVIVTTNFDRLLEAALREAGIEPVVISSAAAAAGATPLPHNRCTILKVHGDYLDPDLKNTVEELSQYDRVIDALLDRILDEYGLVVCGWSGDWDEALRNAILRAPNRRYAAYWASHGVLGERGAQLVEHRSFVTIEIDGADQFFGSLAGKVTTLNDAMNRRPLSAALATAELKRYLPDPVHRIRLHDLVMGEVDRVTELSAFNMNEPQPTFDTVVERMRIYEGAVDTLVPVMATLAMFADQPEHDRLLIDVFRRLVRRRSGLSGGYNTWLGMELYPTLLTLFAAGIGCLARRRIAPLATVLADVQIGLIDRTQPIAVGAATWRIFDEPKVCNRLLHPDGSQNLKTPISDYLHQLLREPLRPLVGSDQEYSALFDDLEYLLAVVCASDYGRGPAGRFIWHREGAQWGGTVIEDYADELLAAGLFTGDPDKVNAAVATYEDGLRKSGADW